MNLYKKLIVLEGADSCGKSTTGDILASLIRQDGFNNILQTFQPGGSNNPAGTILRSLCKEKTWELSPLQNLHCFLADRDMVVKRACSYLAQGYTVICDRWSYSTYAYQLYGKNLLENIAQDYDEDFVKAFADYIKEPYKKTVVPDVVIYFHETVGNRKNDANDLFDNETALFKKRVSAAYESMYETRGSVPWIKVNYGKDEKETALNIRQQLKELCDI